MIYSDALATGVYLGFVCWAVSEVIHVFLAIGEGG